MLTRDFLFGLNILTLAGLIVMGTSLHLARMKKVGAPVAIAGMTAGTALVFFGLYAAHPPT
ncbi:MAG TPA: hypothetical protein VGQ90_05510 [Stellaceae bacterium]|jgi:hypothetical protein|nr:hypothetical protein [Stellaceae bacterium]